MNNSRVLFVGTVQASNTALQAVLTTPGVDVVGVITKKRSRFNSDHLDLAPFAQKANVPWKHVNDINAPYIQKWISKLRPDLIFVTGWSQLLHKDTYSVATRGAIGFHPALLPANRGRHPLIWAIALGLDKTGSTFFLMDEQPDHGGILSQVEIEIDARETSTSLYEKMQAAIATQIPDFLPKFLSGSLKPYNSNLNSIRGNIWRKRSCDDGLIDFRMSTHSIDCLVRALTKPYPGSEVSIRGSRYAVWHAEVACQSVSANIEPGKVLATDPETRRITVKTGDGAIDLVEHDIPKLPDVGSYI
jgi:methionyl-tRNA formyltransferase